MQQAQRARRGDRDAAAVLRPRVEPGARRAGRGAARRPTGSTSAATTCATCAATGPTSSPSPRSACSPRPNVTGGSAFPRLFTEQTSALEVAAAGPRRAGLARGGAEPPPGPRPRAPRARPREAVTAALAPGLRTRAFVFNTLLQDKATKDRLRGYPHWLASRNLANEASDESVEALIEAVAGPLRAGAPLVPRSRRGCSGSTGSPTTTAWRPSRTSDDRIPYGEARGDRARLLPRPSRPSSARRREEFFTGGYIDGPPRPGKRGGAFCSYTVPSAHPYVMLNYTSRPARRAHDGPRARPRRARRARAPAGDLPVHDPADARRDRLDLRRDDRARAAARARARTRPSGSSLLAGSLDGAVGAVFRQVAMNRFEDADPHRAPRARRAVRRSASREPGSPRRPTCSATGSSSTTTTASGGPTSRTSSTRPATSTRTRTATCSRCRSTAATRRRARASSTPTSTCCAPAARCRPRSSARSSAWTSSDPGFWSSGLDLIERQLDAAEAAAARGRARYDVIAERIALPGGEVELMRPPDAEALHHRGGVRARGVPALLGGAVGERRGARARRLAALAARRADARAGLRPRAAEHRRRAAPAGACWPPTGRRTRCAPRPPTRSGTACELETLECSWAEPDAIVERAPWPLVLASDVLYEAPQRRAAARPAAAPRGRDRPRAARRPRPRAGGAVPGRRARARLDRAERGEPAREARAHPPPAANCRGLDDLEGVAAAVADLVGGLKGGLEKRGGTALAGGRAGARRCSA